MSKLYGAVVQNFSLDCSNYSQLNNKKAHETLSQIRNMYSLLDPFREINPSVKRYTWRKKNPLKQARLDYFLISENLLPSINSSKIEASYRSDHSSIIIIRVRILQFTHG